MTVFVDETLWIAVGALAGGSVLWLLLLWAARSGPDQTTPFFAFAESALRVPPEARTWIERRAVRLGAFHLVYGDGFGAFFARHGEDGMTASTLRDLRALGLEKEADLMADATARLTVRQGAIDAALLSEFNAIEARLDEARFVARADSYFRRRWRLRRTFARVGIRSQYV
ncbi:MAG: hypothetical protein AAGI50_17520 [Pseudomonadota bacterium]